MLVDFFIAKLVLVGFSLFSLICLDEAAESRPRYIDASEYIEFHLYIPVESM
jgi:hypothetical protein